jgi:hypothetical protein
MRKVQNTIWYVEDINYHAHFGFKYISKVDVDHYKIIYRKPNKINIFEILQSISLFKKSLLDEKNDPLNVHVSEEDLMKVIIFFQSDKSLSLN